MGKNVLLPLLINAEWKKAKKCVQADKSRARKWITAQSFTGNINKTEILPIHQACAISTVHLDIIEYLAFVYPESLLLCESGTLRTPLHVAMRARVSDRVIAFLMEKCPKAISTLDALGRIPLHYACSNQVSNVTVNRLIDVCPESVCASDNLGWTPLHVASSLYQTADVVEAMLCACPEAVCMRTNKGSSSIAVAQVNNSVAKDRICELLIEMEQRFQKMPAFRNIRAAEKRSVVAAENNKKSTIFMAMRSTKTWGVRKRVRSNSVRCLV